MPMINQLIQAQFSPTALAEHPIPRGYHNNFSSNNNLVAGRFSNSSWNPPVTIEITEAEMKIKRATDQIAEI
jgi:hypothetical protein